MKSFIIGDEYLAFYCDRDVLDKTQNIIVREQRNFIYD